MRTHHATFEQTALVGKANGTPNRTSSYCMPTTTHQQWIHELTALVGMTSARHVSRDDSLVGRNRQDTYCAIPMSKNVRLNPRSWVINGISRSSQSYGLRVEPKRVVHLFPTLITIRESATIIIAICTLETSCTRSEAITSIASITQIPETAPRKEV